MSGFENVYLDAIIKGFFVDNGSATESFFLVIFSDNRQKEITESEDITKENNICVEGKKWPNEKTINPVTSKQPLEEC